MVCQKNFEKVVRNLFALRAPKVLITLVVMCSFLDSFQLEEKWEVIDMFAGEARISRMARQMGMPSVGLDLSYHHNPRAFDLNSEPGFLLALKSILEGRYKE
ncbi:unnamed protein product, partial [Effrenium voratum]